MNKKKTLILIVLLVAVLFCVFFFFASVNGEPTHISFDEPYDTLKILDLRNGAVVELTDISRITELNAIIQQYPLDAVKNPPTEVPTGSIVYLFSYYSNGNSVKQLTFPMVSLVNTKGKAKSYYIKDSESLLTAVDVFLEKEMIEVIS